MHRTLLCALTALASLSLLTDTARAQFPAAFTNGYIEWSMRPDVPRVPNDGAPFSEKYGTGYFTATPLMFGANPNHLWNLYHMDRIERAQRFGYPLPPSYDPEPLPVVRRGGRYSPAARTGETARRLVDGLFALRCGDTCGGGLSSDRVGGKCVPVVRRQ